VPARKRPSRTRASSPRPSRTSRPVRADAVTSATLKKSDATRARIYAAALALFAERGYEETTMRAIAKEAGASLGLAYRYFKRKDDFVLALYRETIDAFAAACVRVPDGDAASRVAWALEQKLALLAPHRAVFVAVVPATLSPNSGAFALGKDADDVRRRVVAAFARVLGGASDLAGLEEERIERLALLCFVANLAVMFFWLHDASAHQERTHALVALLASAVYQGLGLALLPDGEELLAQGAALLAPLFGSASR
jgi:AcrR family transcriptional regulator